MNVRELFYGCRYFIGYRIRNKKDAKSIKEGKWTLFKPLLANWYADPFPFEWNSRFFIFAEKINWWNRKGSIVVCEIKEHTVTEFVEILVEPFHLSFPNVFEYNDEFYMIPESGSNGDIRLYRAIDFPYKWTFDRVLKKGANFVDTSFLRPIKEGKTVLHSYDWDGRKSYYFSFDLSKLELAQLPDNSGMMNERSGGNCFVLDGVTYRVLQDCSNDYGEKLIIRQIRNSDFEDGLASDSEFVDILPADLNLDGNRSPLRCHTYNCSEHLEVVDFLEERFIWYGPISSIHNKYVYEKQKK